MRSNVVKFIRWEIGEIVRYLRDKKTKFRLPLKLLRGSRPKSAMVSSQQCVHSALDFTFGRVGPNSRTRQHRFLPRSVSIIRSKLCFASGA